jgi:hypothetical protein
MAGNTRVAGANVARTIKPKEMPALLVERRWRRRMIAGYEMSIGFTKRAVRNLVLGPYQDDTKNGNRAIIRKPWLTKARNAASIGIVAGKRKTSHSSGANV